MAALYSHTTRTTGTILTATIYNADHQNHIDNGIPAQLDDYSVNVTQMQLATDPGGVGTESLAGNLAGELERLRFAMKRIVSAHTSGGAAAQWYSTPTFGAGLAGGVDFGAAANLTLGSTFAGNFAIEMGRTDGVASTPRMDFHAGATAVDHDARFICQTGTGAVGGGRLQAVLGTFQVVDNATGAIGLQTVTSTGVTQAGTGATSATGSSDFLNLVSAAAAETKLRWFQTGVAEWSMGMTSGNSNMRLRTGNGAGTTLLDVTPAGAFTFTGSVTASTAISLTHSTAGVQRILKSENTDNTNGASHAAIQAISGGSTGGDPVLIFTIGGILDWSVGIDNSDSDKFKIGPNSAVGTSTALTIDLANNSTFSGQITASTATVGGSQIITSTNTDNTNAASHARCQASVGGSSAGDPLFLFDIAGIVDWTVGVDNSDSDKFKIGANASVGTSTALSITTAGAVTFPQPVSFGYDTGAGGTVTQLTSKATAVTLNKPVGSIVTTAAALAANTSVNFQLNDSIIGSNDNVIVTFGNGAQTPGAYNVWAQTGPGLATITLKNVTAGSLSEAVTINFAVVKGVVA